MAKRDSPGLDLDAIGELGLIEVVRRRAARGARAAVLGIGDDAAMLRPRPGRDWVFTSDALIEDVHFRWRTTDARSLGRKALAVNLSDLAAMGAEPRGFLLSWGLPQGADAARIDGFLSGLLSEARATACPLLGGDTVRADSWMLSITAFGEVERGRALLRSAARPGDRVLVTGQLGGAALGLELLERGRDRESSARAFVRRHVRPAARLEAGRRLVGVQGVGAVIDLSDGVWSDLARVARASGVAVDVDLERIPLARGLRRWCGELGVDALDLAVAGGEDYELLFCVRARAPSARALARRLGCAVTEIGLVREGRGVHFWREGARTSAVATGFEHFKQTPGRSDK